MTEQRIEIVGGLAMPFFPMRPTKGRTLKTPASVEDFWKTTARSQDWIVQPKMAGDRACLAVVDGKVYVQNRHGGWYGHNVDTTAFKRKLPDRTALDGEVRNGLFHPFEALAVNGKSLLRCTTSEREVLAYQLTRLVEQRWMFERPSKRWLLSFGDRLPDWDGVVLKKAQAPYVLLGSSTQMSPTWFKRVWKNT